MDASTDLLHFLTRARRRWIAWRVGEATCVAAAGFALVALLSLPLVSQALQGWQWVVGLTITGGLAGLVWMIQRLPTLLQTAIELDRQGRTHELLATALRGSSVADEAFFNLVRVGAKRFCEAHSPAELVVHRLGARSWSGIVLALLGAGAVAAMITPHERAAAGNVEAAAGVFAAPTTAAQAQSLYPHSSESPRPHEAQRVGTQGAERNESDADPLAAASAAHPTLRDKRAGGTGNAQTQERMQSGSLGFSASRSSASASGTPSPLGGGTSSNPSAPGAADSTALAARQTVAPQAPAWKPADAGSARAAALQAIDEDRVPASYRDLVRAYFDPQRAGR